MFSKIFYFASSTIIIFRRKIENTIFLNIRQFKITYNSLDLFRRFDIVISHYIIYKYLRYSLNIYHVYRAHTRTLNSVTILYNILLYI